MNDNQFLTVTFVCAIILFLLGYLSGTQYQSYPLNNCDSRLDTCNKLLDYCSESNNLPINCSNPIYNTDNYWYCEVN